jgi:hypothetical protein
MLKASSEFSNTVRAGDPTVRLREVWFLLSDDERFSFIESNIKIENAKGSTIPLVLTQFQRMWLHNGPLFNNFATMTIFNNRICLKCRNIGASYLLIALEAVLTCWIYGKVFIPFISATEPQSKDLIGYCVKVIENCSFKIPLMGEVKDQTSMLIKFANGSKIRAFAGGNPAGIRGPRSIMVYLDEFSFIPNQQEILSASEYFLAEGGCLSVLSTPFGKNNMFWKIWADRINYKDWIRVCVSLFTDMRGFDVEVSLKRQILEHGFILSCPWLNIDFLEKKRQQDAPNGYMNFLQEMCAVPFEEASGAISSGVLDANSMDSYYCEGRINKEQVFVMGADFGANRNVTAVCVFKCKDGRFIVCYTTTIRGAFPSQKRAMLELVKRFRPNIFVGDSTGMGGKAWMDTLSEEIDDQMVIVPLNYSKKDLALADGQLDLNNKNYMVETTIRLMSEGLIITPKNHRDLRDELLGMQKIVYEKTIKYSGKEGLVGRDDLAFAFLEGGFMYSRIYSMGNDDHIGVVDSGMTLSRGYKPDTRKPKITSGNYEGGSVSMGGSEGLKHKRTFGGKYDHLI